MEWCAITNLYRDDARGLPVDLGELYSSCLLGPFSKDSGSNTDDIAPGT